MRRQKKNLAHSHKTDTYILQVSQELTQHAHDTR
uniref:Uncharacterized protein n=1 Tax=Arundo donax TaxID=35708 RepID=A0A0A9B6B0_ARUDO